MVSKEHNYPTNLCKNKITLEEIVEPWMQSHISVKEMMGIF